jgi:hypothetical protein
MALTITSSVLLVVYIVTLVAATVAQAKRRYNRFVSLNVAALGLALVILAASAMWADSWITTALWGVTCAVQALGTWNARRIRRYWTGPPDPDAHTCTEDCPGWVRYTQETR